MARAINSLPTPDSPSISTGITEAAAFSAARNTGRMASERVMMSAIVSVPSRLRLRRCTSPASARAASALCSETCRRSGLAGLTTKSAAPARMAETTLSMPPWAVCTITGTATPASRSRDSTPSPSRSGITRSSTTQSTGARRRRSGASPPHRRPRRSRLIAEARTIASTRRRWTGSSSTMRTVSGMSGAPSAACAELEQSGRSALMRP